MSNLGVSTHDSIAEELSNFFFLRTNFFNDEISLKLRQDIAKTKPIRRQVGTACASRAFLPSAVQVKHTDVFIT